MIYYESVEELGEDLRDPKALRMALAKERLAQREHHLSIQEEKMRMLKAKREKEEADRRARKLERALRLHWLKQTAQTIAYLTATAASLLLTLRTLAKYNPDVRHYYYVLIERLNAALSATVRGVAGSARKLSEVVGQIRNFLKKDNRRSDSRSIRRIKHIKGIRTRRLIDRRVKDIVPAVIAGMSFKTTILPILGIAVKAGITAGVAGAISQGILGPIIRRIKDYGFALLRGKANGEFSGSIISKIKNDLSILIKVFRTEDPKVARQLEQGLTKFDRATR